MEDYAQALTYAIPIFLLLIGMEALISWRMGIEINRGPDMISSMSSGVTNIIKDVLGLSIVIVSYTWLVERVALFEIQNAWYVYVIAFVAKDFAGYWIHRLEHTINFLWNRHIIHHSSEEFNLSCALRQSISEVFSYVTIFLIPAALLGIPGQVIAVIAPIQLFAQFWYHTRLINKMGWLEHLMVTPSHHRVHHAINPEYIDKNYGQIFILWDKWFRTFQPELEEVPAVYGVKRPVHTWNPFLINFQHFWLLLADAIKARNWRDKIKIWFMPTGWRPLDVASTYPVTIISDVFRIVKYDSAISKPLLKWSWIQWWVILVLSLFLFFRFAEIGLPGAFLYGLYIFAAVFSMTSLMDKASYAWVAEGIKFLISIILLYLGQGDWFGISTVIPFANYFVAAYIVTSLSVSLYFQYAEVRRWNIGLSAQKIVGS
ncbi:MAG: sterol desaturase family protein [Bacteroidota bacterium]|nr:sterol desaturase family protein [Bacteroidota bacterium]